MHNFKRLRDADIPSKQWKFLKNTKKKKKMLPNKEFDRGIQNIVT